MDHERNCMSYWYPKLVDAGFGGLMPKTKLIKLSDNPYVLQSMVDHELPAVPEFDELVGKIIEAGSDIPGPPWFLRSGHTSAKHGWKDTCCLKDMVPRRVGVHVWNIIEMSVMVDMFGMGLPTNVWAVREFLEPEVLFTTFYGKMPVTREWRFFVDDGRITHKQPYWPMQCVAGEYVKSDPDWEAKLRKSYEWPSSFIAMEQVVRDVSRVLPDEWSVDVIFDKHDDGWITDCAVGADSFRYDPAENLAPAKATSVEYAKLMEVIGSDDPMGEQS